MNSIPWLGLALVAAVPLASQQPRCEAPATTEPFIPALTDSGRIFRGALSADGREFWYFRKVSADPDAEDYRIYVTTRGPAGWSPARRVDLGGEHSDLYPALTLDGRRLVFASYRRAAGDTASHPNASLWYAGRQGDRWGPAQYIASATEPGFYHSQITVAANGDLYFRRTSPDWRRTDEYMAPAVAGGYGPARLVEGADRWANWRPGHYVWGARPGHDGSYMILDLSTIDSTGRRSPPDVWFSRRVNGTWSDPRPFGAGVNTPEAENFASVTPDGCALIFTRGFSSFHRVLLAAAMEGE